MQKGKNRVQGLQGLKELNEEDLLAVKGGSQIMNFRKTGGGGGILLGYIAGKALDKVHRVLKQAKIPDYPPNFYCHWGR